MATNYNVIPTMSSGFREANSAKPMVGQLEMPYLEKTPTAIVTVDGLVEGDLVTIVNSNAVNLAGTSGLDKFNANSLTVTGKATSATDFSGILLRGGNQIADLNSMGVPALGSYTYVATIGSGLETYVKCDDSYVGANINADLLYDFSNSIFSKNGTGVAVPVKIVSGVVDGQEKVIAADGTVSYEDCLVVRVRL